MFIREGFWLGPIFIYFYAVIILAGVIAASWLSSSLAKKNGYDPDTVWDMLPWILIGGIIGARLWHIFTPPASMVEQGITTMYYLTHPLDAINIRKGGLGIPGAVMGGVFALWIYCRRKKINTLVWLDFLAPAVALAQGIGRWGNFVNQELYGAPTNLPWAIFINTAHRLPGFENIETYHPLFLYESLWNLFVCLLLLYLMKNYKSWLIDGDIFRSYLILYPFARFLLEFLRLDPSPMGGLNINQTLMAIVMISSIIWLILTHQHRPELPVSENPASEVSDIDDDDDDDDSENETLSDTAPTAPSPDIAEEEHKNRQEDHIDE